VARGDLVGLEEGGTSIEGLASKNTTKGAVVLQADLEHDPVHRPAVELFVAHDPEGNAIVLLIPLDRLRGAISS